MDDVEMPGPAVAEVEEYSDLLFQQIDVDNINVGDKNVELYAIVHMVTTPGNVGPNGQWELMKFMLSNRQGLFIQCSVWNEDIARHRAKIILGAIIHINGAWAKQAEARFNRGTVPFELSMQRLTEIEVCQENVSIEVPRTDPIAILLEDVGSYMGQFVDFEGYLKSPFQVIAAKGATTYGSSAICKGERVTAESKCDRIDLHLIPYVPSDDHAVGQKFRVSGIPKEERDKFGISRVYLEVTRLEDMSPVAGQRKTSRDMIRCVRNARKPTVVE